MSVPKRFGVLRLVGWVLKIVAWIVLVVAILFAIIAGIASGGGGLQLLGDLIPPDSAIGVLLSSVAGGILAGLGVLLIGVIYFLLLYASGESFHLQIALEENTRLTAALLLRMHQESQQDTRATYGAAAFESEQFDR
jgi:ABC-type Fe3+ transport system permease subunit